MKMSSAVTARWSRMSDVNWYFFIQSISMRQETDPSELKPTSAIYDRNFTRAEIIQFNQFYKTSAGSKLVNSQKKILQESQSALQQWAAKVNARLTTVLDKQRQPSSAAQQPSNANSSRH